MLLVEYRVRYKPIERARLQYDVHDWCFFGSFSDCRNLRPRPTSRQYSASILQLLFPMPNKQ
jgi:hypothetical protein